MRTKDELEAIRLGREAAKTDQPAWHAIGDYCQYGYSDLEVQAFIEAFLTWRAAPADDLDLDEAWQALTPAFANIDRALEVVQSDDMRRLLTYWRVRYRSQLMSPPTEVAAVIDELLLWADGQAPA